MGQNSANTGMATLNVEASDDLKREYRFSIEFYIFMEGESHIAYCPSLDISSSGASFNEAISNFYEAFQLHIECCVAMGTLEEDLRAHGWQIKKEGIRPPSIATLVKKPEMQRLFDGGIGYEKVVTPARIPCCV